MARKVKFLKSADVFEEGFLDQILLGIGLGLLGLYDPKTGTLKGLLKSVLSGEGAKSIGASEDVVTGLVWTDVNGNPLISLSGLSITESELRSGLGIGTPDEGDTAVSYPFLVSLLDGKLRVDGSSGDDRHLEVGAGGKATVKGGKGDDKLFVWHEKTVDFDGGKDIDTILFSANGPGDPYPTPATQQLVVDLDKGNGQNPYGGKLKLENVENVVGTPGADKITGDNKANIIGDGAFDLGADIIKAKGGADVVMIAPFSEGGIRADGGKGKDELHFSVSQPTADEVWTVLDLADPGNNTGSLKGGVFKGFEIFTAGSFTGPHHHLDFRGGNAGETVVGLLGADKLDGRGGDDTLDGKGGNDTMTGGAGKDTFLFASLPGAANVDTVVDFTPGTDRIGIAAFNFEAVGDAGKLAAAKFNALSEQDGNDVVLYDKATGGLYHDPDGLGGTSPVHFATLANTADLRAGDIIVV
jgi:Ca2+-binding RTX toxin-like protein